jgi:hypothetical protein
MKYMILILSVSLILILDAVFSYSFVSRFSLVNKLNMPPNSHHLYFLGNSMFKTGIDFELLNNNLLPEGEHADFEYHNGQYTNLWYLLIKNAIVPSSEHPKILVWGFRPTYANEPAFRQNKIGPIEEFCLGNDSFYESMISQQDFSQKDKFTLWLANNSFLFGNREDIKRKISSFINNIGVSFLKPLMSSERAAEIEDMFFTRKLTVSDFLVNQLSDGRYVMVEETVVDNGRKFIRGKKVKFDQSFIPIISSMISDAGIPQLVLIFKPAAYSKNELGKGPIKFAIDAEKYFKSKSIQYINFMKDDSISEDLYAKGDHYNTRGREHVTKAVSDKIKLMLATVNDVQPTYSNH